MHMPAEDRTKYLKIAGLVFVVALVILLGALVNRCGQGGSPQNDETAPDRDADDITHVTQARQPVAAVAMRSHATPAPLDLWPSPRS